MLGTPPYMAPEQINKGFGPITRRCDIYSLGIVAYHIISGKLPFDGNLAVMLDGHMNRPHVPLATLTQGAVPRALSDVVDRAMMKRPEARYPSMNDMRRAFETALRAMGETDGATPDFGVGTQSAPPAFQAPPPAPPLPPAPPPPWVPPAQALVAAAEALRGDHPGGRPRRGASRGASAPRADPGSRRSPRSTIRSSEGATPPNLRRRSRGAS